MFNLGLKCNKFRPPTFTFLSSGSSPCNSSLFQSCSFPCQCILLRVAVGVISCRLISCLFFLSRRFSFFVVSPVCFVSRRFLGLPITSHSFSVFFFSLSAARSFFSFSFLSFSSSKGNLSVTTSGDVRWTASNRFLEHPPLPLHASGQIITGKDSCSFLVTGVSSSNGS